jgi:AcrR family transcriptional regulator
MRIISTEDVIRKSKKPPQRMEPNERRQSMLQAGVRLFGSRPYSEVSIQDICDEAGVSRPLLQHYFGSKEQFFAEVIGDAMNELERRTRPKSADEGFGNLELNLRAYFSFTLEHPVGATLARSSNENVGAMAEKLFQAYRDRTYDLIVDTIGKKQMTPQMGGAIRCWIGLNETIATQLRSDAQLTVEWAAGFSQRMLFQMLEAPSELSS